MVISRRNLSMGLMAVAAGATVAACSPSSPTAPAPTTAPAQGYTSLGPLKQVNAGLLDVGYAEVGPPDGRPVILLHGWPYDIHSYVDVAPALAAQGYRVIVPFARGYGSTRFLSATTRRNGQQGALATDVV